MKTIVMEGDLIRRVATALAQAPMFQGLTPEQIDKVIPHATLVQFEGGETLTRESEPSDAVLLILKGEAGVRVTERHSGEPVDIGRLHPPDTVGEIGVLLEQPRSATVIAIGPVLAVHFAAASFAAMFMKIPAFGIAIARGLARRLAQVSHQVPLPEWEPGGKEPSVDVVGLLPVDFLQRHRILPLEVRGNLLTIGFVEEPDPRVLASARKMLPSMDLKPVRVGAELVSETLKALTGVVSWAAEGHEQVVTAGDGESPDRLAASPKLDQLLRRMVAEGASDLHLSAGHRPRWRVDGSIKELADTPPLGKGDVIDLLISAMNERTQAAFEENDCDFAYALPGVARFRVNMFRDNFGLGAVLRQIPDKILTFEQLGLPPVIETMCRFPKGLVLVTGPTGSGKSTTLAAMIDSINKKRRDHIITLEDPIEFVHRSQKCLVNQREVGAHTKTFSRALKAALREDPDIVLVGEMRDLETVSLALETANTGHLVFGTLHTATAVSTVDRIINLFPADQQAQVRTTLSDTLKSVVAQTLCRKIGGGRVAALEILMVNHAVANLIREGKNHQIASSMATGRAHGNMLLNEELARLVQEKKVDYDEALSKAADKADLARRCGKDAEKS